MENITNEYLLQIESKHKKLDQPIDDVLTHKMEELLFSAIDGVYSHGNFMTNNSWRGCHTCICGERSGNKDLMIRSGHVTNSLAVHYLRWHRDEIPESEIRKLKYIEDYEINQIYEKFKTK